MKRDLKKKLSVQPEKKNDGGRLIFFLEEPSIIFQVAPSVFS